MKKSRFTEEQIIGILQQQEAGRTTAEVCRETGISAATFYAWKAKFGGLNVTEAQRLRQLEAENAKLRRVVADLTLDNVALRDVLSKNGEARAQKRSGGLLATTAWPLSAPRGFSGGQRAQSAALPEQARLRDPDQGASARFSPGAPALGLTQRVPRVSMCCCGAKAWLSTARKRTGSPARTFASAPQEAAQTGQSRHARDLGAHAPAPTVDGGLRPRHSGLWARLSHAQRDGRRQPPSLSPRSRHQPERASCGARLGRATSASWHASGVAPGQRAGVPQSGPGRVGARAWRGAALHRAGQTDSERAHRVVQWPLRDECLKQERFTSLFHARCILAEWKLDYNTVRSHSALDYLTPTEWAQQHAHLSTFD